MSDHQSLQKNYRRLAAQEVHLPDSVKIHVEDDRTGMSPETLKRAFWDNLRCIQGKDEQFATLHDYYAALAHSVRDRLMHRRIETSKTYFEKDVKTVY